MADPALPFKGQKTLHPEAHIHSMPQVGTAAACSGNVCEQVVQGCFSQRRAGRRVWAPPPQNTCCDLGRKPRHQTAKKWRAPKHGAARLRALPCSAASRSSDCSGHDKEGRARASSGLRLHLQRHPLRLRCCKGPGASGMPESKLGVQLPWCGAACRFLFATLANPHSFARLLQVNNHTRCLAPTTGAEKRQAWR